MEERLITVKWNLNTVMEKIVPFSFENKPEDLEREQVKCWLTYTNEETHKVIRENLDRSPLYSGYIKGTGPRYCPSIEDKVVRFADKNRHQVFIEPEGNYTNEMYIGGMSSSLPEDVQEKMYRSVPGLEHAKIVRNAYAIEYDCLDSLELLPTLELKKSKRSFLVPDRQMEVPVMKKLLHKDLLPVSMPQENVLEKSQLSLIVRRDMLVF